jgi:pimeloyl-ACP methyl ester carboxylesterase
MQACGEYDEKRDLLDEGIQMTESHDQTDEDERLTSADAMPMTQPRAGYAPVNGLQMYYEIHGTGLPLILLHGGLGTISLMFGQLLPRLAENRQVIAVELQGHGHTADIARPLSYAQMADDVAALCEHLGLEHADIFGYSLGGGVALQTAIRHAELVRKLGLASVVFRRVGWYPEALAGMAALNADFAVAMMQFPLYEHYARVAPRPDDWPNLVVKLSQMLGQDYDWSEGVAQIKAPTLIMVGDADSVRPAHIFEMFALLGGGLADGMMGDLPRSQLAVLPGTTHVTVLDRTDLLFELIVPFLDAPVPERG